MKRFKTFRVRVCDWRAFTIHIRARSAEHAIELAQTMHDERGTEPFKEVDADFDGWEAEEVQP
jgi:hypothetical protein